MSLAIASSPSFRLGARRKCPQAVPARRTDRAFWAILSGLLLFAAIQLGLQKVIVSDGLSVRDPIYTEKFALVKKHPEFWRASADRPRVLALGSSRTQLLIDAARLAPDYAAFNFGCSSCGPIAQLLYFRRLLAAGLRAEILLLEIHPAFLAELPTPFELRWLHPHRLQTFEAAELQQLGIPIDSPESPLAPGLQTTSHYRQALLNEFGSHWLPDDHVIRRPMSDSHGYVQGIEPTTALRAELLTRASREYAPVFEDYRPGGIACDALGQIIDLARHSGLRPVLFVTPESSEFRGWYGAAGNSRFVEFAARLPGPLLQTREALPDSEFADGHHATAAGARAFTEFLRRNLGETP